MFGELTIEIRLDERVVVLSCDVCEISLELPLTEAGDLPAAAGEFAALHSRELHGGTPPRTR